MAGVHGLPFIISANRASRTEMTLPSWAKPDDGLVQELLLVLARCRWRLSGKFAEGPAKRRQHFLGVVEVEEIDQPPSSGLRRGESPARRMKRVAAIQKSSRTMTMHCTRPPSHCRRACTSSVFVFFLLGVEPLLELVEDDQHLLARGNALAHAAGRPAFPSDPGWRARPDSVCAGRSAGGFPFPRPVAST